MDNPSDNYKSDPGTQSGPLQTLLGTIESSHQTGDRIIYIDR